MYHNHAIVFFFVKGAKERVRESAWMRDHARSHFVREDRTRLLAYWQTTRRCALERRTMRLKKIDIITMCRLI